MKEIIVPGKGQDTRSEKDIEKQDSLIGQSGDRQP